MSRAQSVEAERDNITGRIESLKATRHTDPGVSAENSEVLGALKRDLDRVSHDIAVAQNDLDQTRLAVEDAGVLIADIRRSIEQLQQSQATGAALGPITFTFCPSCLSPVASPTEFHTCHLCKAPVDSEQNRSRYARIRNELDVQLNELKRSADRTHKETQFLPERLGGLHRIRTILAGEFQSASRSYTTEHDAEIDKLTRRLGYLERELLDIERERRVANEVAT